MINFLIYDFDGVIANTNALKINAFKYALRDEPTAHVTSLIKYHIDNGGITRQEKFKYYLSFISKEESDAKYDRFIKDFSTYCQDNMHATPVINGVDDFIKKVHDIEVPQYIVSGGNRDEIISYLDNKNLLKYFSEIYGNPTPKKTSMNELYQNYCRGDGIYFGDAKLDYELATKYNLRFVFVKKYSDWLDWGEALLEQRVTIIDDFDDININFLTN